MQDSDTLKSSVQSGKRMKTGAEPRFQAGGRRRVRIDEFEELLSNYRPGDRFLGLCDHRDLGWIIAARCLGLVSRVMLYLACAGFVLGPFTCFVSWEWTVRLLIWGAPIFGITALIQVKALAAIAKSFRWHRQQRAIDGDRVVALMGLALSAGCLALAAYFGLWEKILVWL
jgi:hypothetical protein